MAKKSKKTVTSVKVDKELVSQVIAEKEEEPKEMTTIEKVQLMSSLASIATDSDIKESLTSRVNGDIVYDIFIEAVEKRLNAIMDGKEGIPEQVTSILSATGRIDTTLQEFQRMIMGFMDTPLVEVLNLMNRNLGGKKFDFDKDMINNAPAAVAYEQRQQPAQQRQQPVQQHEEENAATRNSYSRNNNGIGSF